MRILYIVAPGTPIGDSVIAASGGAEIVSGLPPALQRAGVTGTYPFTYTEPDDPAEAPYRTARTRIRQILDGGGWASLTPLQQAQTMDGILRLLARLTGA